MRKTDLKAQPESSGSSATLWAMPTWKGLIGLNAEPTIAAPRAHRHGGRPGEAQARGEQQEDRQHGHDLLLHVLERAGRREEDPNDRDHHELAPSEAIEKPFDQAPERPVLSTTAKAPPMRRPGR